MGQGHPRLVTGVLPMPRPEDPGPSSGHPALSSVTAEKAGDARPGAQLQPPRPSPPLPSTGCVFVDAAARLAVKPPHLQGALMSAVPHTTGDS